MQGWGWGVGGGGREHAPLAVYENNAPEAMHVYCMTYHHSMHDIRMRSATYLQVFTRGQILLPSLPRG